jgi:hypothetical protein
VWLVSRTQRTNKNVGVAHGVQLDGLDPFLSGVSCTADPRRCAASCPDLSGRDTQQRRDVETLIDSVAARRDGSQQKGCNASW